MTNAFKRIITAIIKAFKRMFNAFRRKTRDLPGSPDIRVIGARRSGKTTFLAALAYWPNAKPDSPIESVSPFDDETAKLISMAQDLLENGLPFAGNYLAEDPNDLPFYTLLIEMKPAFQLAGNIRFQVSCRDYPGELMEELRNGSTSSAVLRNYLDDCADASGILLLIDGTSKEDRKYSQALDKLKAELNIRLTGQGKNLNTYRIALVFSKAEQASIWVHRHDIQKFINLKFPRTQGSLEKWRKEWGCSVNFFFCSAFGMKGKPPKPNVRVEVKDTGATCGVIDRTQYWRPFGLVAPIYWLHTGKDDRRLRKMED